jgi:hypothetical protein
MKSMIVGACLVSVFSLSYWQSKVPDKETLKKDSVVMKDIFEPLVTDAVNNEETPDWAGLKSTLTTKYDAAFAERFTCKAKIYYYYDRDWPEFSAALVYYTNTYEDHNNAKLLNKNANMILKFSTDAKQLQEALGWSKQAVAKEPSNADYKQTYAALNSKLSGK